MSTGSNAKGTDMHNGRMSFMLVLLAAMTMVACSGPSITQDGDITGMYENEEEPRKHLELGGNGEFRIIVKGESVADGRWTRSGSELELTFNDGGLVLGGDIRQDRIVTGQELGADAVDVWIPLDDVDTYRSRTPIVVLGDDVADADYVTRRARLEKRDGEVDVLRLVYKIMDEMVLRQVAQREGVGITDDGVTREIRDLADHDGVTSNEEFEEWYEQLLRETGLSDIEYRDIIRAQLLMEVFREQVYAAASTATEQVHLHFMTFGSLAAASDARGRLLAGEEFETIAQELSGDMKGDFGWLPRFLLPSQLQSIVFALGIRESTEPVASSSDTDTFFIYMVSERASARELAPEYLPLAKRAAFTEWLDEERQRQPVQVRGFGSGQGIGALTIDWIERRI